MKKQAIKIIFIIILSIPVNISAQPNLTYPIPTAKSIGMGGSSVALPTDPSAGYWNPAGIAFLITDRMLINIDDISQFNYIGITKFFPPATSMGLNISQSKIDTLQYNLATISIGRRISSNLSFGGNLNIGKYSDNNIFSSFGLGAFFKAMPNFKQIISTTNTSLSWLHPTQIHDRLNFGVTFHNIAIHNIKNSQTLRAAAAYKPSLKSPIFHLGYQLSHQNYSFHFGSQVNLLQNFDLFLGAEDFDINKTALGGSFRISIFQMDICYALQNKKINFSLLINFSEDKNLLAQKHRKRGIQHAKKQNFVDEKF